MTDESLIANAVLVRRHELGLSQAEVARRARISPTTLGRLETHHEALTPRTLAKVGAALGWAVGWEEVILGGGSIEDVPATEPERDGRVGLLRDLLVGMIMRMTDEEVERVAQVVIDLGAEPEHLVARSALQAQVVESKA